MPAKEGQVFVQEFLFHRECMVDCVDNALTRSVKSLNQVRPDRPNALEDRVYVGCRVHVYLRSAFLSRGIHVTL